MKVFFSKFSALVMACSLNAACAQAESPAALACKAPSEINEAQFKSLVQYSAQLIDGKAKLELPKNCEESVTIADKSVPNPFPIALAIAAQKKQPSELALAFAAQQKPNSPMEEKALQHSEWLRAIKVACGDQLACVKQTIHSIHEFNVAESPIFCAFTRMADYTVHTYYQQQPKPSYPVACLGNSSLTAGNGLSPMQDWFEAYKLLGK